MKTKFHKDGIIQVDGLLDNKLTDQYAEIYSKFLRNEINA